MSFGFSVGDFLAAGKIVADLLACLKDAGGSKDDYQELIRELENLDRALAHVEKLSSPESDGIKCAALTCRYALEDFLRRAEKYSQSLSFGNTRGMIKESARKVQWLWREKHRVEQLRAYLSLHIGSINMSLAAHGLERLQVAVTKEDQTDFNRRLDDTSAKIVRLAADVESQGLVVRRSQSILKRLFDLVRGDVAGTLKLLGDLVTSACVSVQQVHTILAEFRQYIYLADPRFTYLQAPILVEDALGRVFPVPSEYSFSDLECVIRNKFKNNPGMKLVENGLYDLVNARNSSQLFTADNCMRLLPGMKLIMAIFLRQNHVTQGQCPMPHCTSTTIKDAPGGGSICCVCNVWFDIKRPAKRNCLEHDLEDTGEGNDRISKRRKTSNRASIKRAREFNNDDEEDEEDDIAAFRNIRFLPKRTTTRPRESSPNSVEDDYGEKGQERGRVGTPKRLKYSFSIQRPAQSQYELKLSHGRWIYSEKPAKGRRKYTAKPAKGRVTVNNERSGPMRYRNFQQGIHPVPSNTGMSRHD